jgi:hypothetical protein
MQLNFWRKNIIYTLFFVMILTFLGCEKTRKGYEESAKKKGEALQKAKVNTDNLNKAMEQQGKNIKNIGE